MIPRPSGGRSFRVGAPLGALLTLLACSSSEDASSAHPETDGGDGGQATPDSGAVADSGGDAADAGESEPPPPYDFAVKCAADPCVTQIAARGGKHACAALQDGTVRCWGSNGSGQLGTGESDGGAGYEATPRRVLGVSNAKALSATGDGTAGTTCVVSGAGEVVCFGSNAWGQLGRGAGSSSGPNPDPAVVEGIQAKSVTLASTFALAIGADDRLWSWGANDAHQLARDVSAPDAGSPTEASVADRVAAPVRSCAGTSKTGFVVAPDGSLLSWGGGTSEQLGRPTSLARDPVPAAVALSDVSSVTTGALHACALSRGKVYCWGKNTHGQLGTGRKAEEIFPARVALPGDVYPVYVAAGGNNSCIIAANGDVYCWGANGDGQLGNASGLDDAMPVRVDGIPEQSVAVAVMDDAICALLRGGSVACWGDNLVGQLGRGSRDLASQPQPGTVVLK